MKSWFSKDRTTNERRGYIVQQPGRSQPVISDFRRNHWIDIRSNAKGNLARAHAALATGEVEGAVQLARVYLKKHPGDAEGLMVLAAGLALNGQYELASYYAGLVERKNPGDPVALNIQALAIMLAPKSRIDDYMQAVALFQQAFEDDRQIAPGLNLGHLYLELGNAKAARSVFQEVNGRCGGCNAGLMGFGIASSRTGNYKEAVASFESVLKADPDHPAALYHLALAHKNGYNDNKKAEKYLFKLLASTSNKDVYLKEKAHSVLRAIKSEAPVAERTERVRHGDEEDAELLMSTSDFTEE